MAKRKSALRAADSELSGMGLNHKKIAGLVMIIIGALLVIGNISGALLALVGLVLIYFGLWIFGYQISLSDMLNS